MVDAVLPLFLFAGIAVALAAALIAAGRLLGPKRRGAVKSMPYESGMDPIHDTRRRFDVKFSLVAIAFLIFDVELLFLYPWAVARTHPEGIQAAVREQVRSQQVVSATGADNQAGIDQEVRSRLWVLFFSVMAFLALVTAGLVYDWRKGIFNWR